MFKKSIALVIMAGFISAVSGCALINGQGQTTKTFDTHSIDNELTMQHQEIVNTLKEQSSQQERELKALTAQVENLTRQINHTHRSINQKVVTIPVPAKCPESLGDKFLLGQVEYVYIDELKASFDTRIDTGAVSSSLDARNIVLFERDGNQWVRFDVYTDGKNAKPKTFESKVERFVKIKQDPKNQDDRRPVIKAHLQIGKYSAETDLNLTDRSHLEYPLLLGRKFMKDIAIVDVGQSYINGKPTKAFADTAK